MNQSSRILLLSSITLFAGVLSSQGAELPDGIAPDSSLDVVALLSRWAHVLAAVILVGGAFFQRFIILPSLQAALDEDKRGAVMTEVVRRWKKAVHIGGGIILLSGFYNYLGVTRHAHEGDGPYHMMMGMKMLLAFLVILLASFMVGRTSVAQKMRGNALKWTTVIFFLGLIITMIAGFLKFR